MKSFTSHTRISLCLLLLFINSSAETTNWITDSPLVKRSPLSSPKPTDHPFLFSKIEGPNIGIDFQNLLKTENIKNFTLNGAGLSIADIDQNGLPDLFLVSQDGPNKLFKQITPWNFQDATEASGIKDINAWGAGAAFADLDNDGDLDLYVCNKGARDELYFNKGDGTFSGSTLGSGDPTHRAPTMVAFSDFDCDGDLDFYRTETRLFDLATMFGDEVQMIKDSQGNWQADPRHKGEFEVIDGIPRALGTHDHLYQNQGPSKNSPVNFKEITNTSGISTNRDLGLAAVWWDYNNDHFPDLYVSNDFHTPDHLYRNNQNGTFSEITPDALPYTSWYSMGSDFADINNDGWFDYLSTDMSATTHFKQKTMMGSMSSSSWFLDNLEPRQYMRNAMHINTGTEKFIDVAFSAGLDSTDWTWTGIFGDLDNDGLEDLFFTNGIERNVQDTDANIRMEKAKKAGATREELQEIFLKSPRHQERNLSFKNLGKLNFQNTSKEWGLDDLTVSHGAILSDLDRDGDLDLIVNNMNDPVGIYRNNSSQNALLVSLKGTTSNRFGLGARITAQLPNGTSLTRTITSSRGYMSGVEPLAHFGLGSAKTIPTLTITWPGGKNQTLKNLTTNQHYLIQESPEATSIPLPKKPNPLFTKAPKNQTPPFDHRENLYNDFLSQPLLPNRLSRFGPAMAIADLNRDQLPDIFLGGAAGQPSQLFLQTKNGTFQNTPLPWAKNHQNHEDVAATFFDSDQDGDLDLYVVSGGASHPNQHLLYQDRLYLNDGTGNLSPAPADTLPPLRQSGSCVAPCDFDADGDLDLFIGSRHVPNRYPTSPKSSLLINNNGSFTLAESPAAHSGMVTAATWADTNGDSRPDLIIATEWGPIRIFKNTPHGLLETTKESGLSPLTGWWTSLAAVDIDHDGDIDIIGGNFGSNTKYQVDSTHPATLFAADFGNQGQLQLVEAQHKEGKLLPIRGRSCSSSAMPHLKKIAPTYTAFASKTLPQLYTPSALNSAIKLEASTLLSTLFRNNGKGNFTPEPLPLLAQLSPVMSIATGDFNQDGLTDVALGQNFYDAQRETGRMNASLGLILKGQKNKPLQQLWPLNSGFTQRTNLRFLKAIDLNNDQILDLITANNNQPPEVFHGQKN